MAINEKYCFHRAIIARSFYDYRSNQIFRHFKNVIILELYYHISNEKHFL